MSDKHPHVSCVTERLSVRDGKVEPTTVMVSIAGLTEVIASGNEAVIEGIGKFSKSLGENFIITFTPEESFESRISELAREKFDRLHEILSVNIFPGDKVAWIDEDNYWVAKVAGILRKPKVGLELIRPDGSYFTIDWYEGAPLYKIGDRIGFTTRDEEDDE